MSRTTYFDQECPTCGRHLRVRVEYIDQKVVCQHCQGQFEACNPVSASNPPSDLALALLQKADELLDRSSRASSSSRN